MVALTGDPTVKLIVPTEVNEGAASTVRVKLWVAVPVTLVAVKMRGYDPPAPEVGVPDSVVPLKDIPDGRVPERVMEEAFDAATVKERALPAVTEAEEEEVNAGAGGGCTGLMNVTVAP